MVRKIIEAVTLMNSVHVQAKPGQSLIRQIYLQLLGDQTRVPGKCVMFHNSARPKARFSLWLILQNKQLTVDKLDKWGMTVDKQCVLCQAAEESRDHLYVHCKYSKRIWMKISNWILRTPITPSSWDQQVQYITVACKGKSQQAQLFKLVYTEYSYVIWLERNAGIFEKKAREWDQIAREIAYTCNVRAPTGLASLVQQLSF